MTYLAPVRTRLDAMIDELSAVLRAAPPAGRHRAAAEVLACHCVDPALLASRDCAGREEGYTRHLLHEDPGQGWAVAALVWRPGQMSAVHAHDAWCAVGFHRGVLTETFYEPGDPVPVPRAALLRRPGDLSHAPADPDAIHRIANLGTVTALSIHAYGLPYARFGCDLNRIYAA